MGLSHLFVFELMIVTFRFFFQDSKLLTSISATERVKLWDKFTGPVDQDAVKIDFFRKIHRKNPPFRIKVRLPRRNTVQVPDMVKYCYKKPVSLLPKLRDVLRLESVTKRKEMEVRNGILKFIVPVFGFGWNLFVFLRRYCRLKNPRQLISK